MCEFAGTSYGASKVGHKSDAYVEIIQPDGSTVRRGGHSAGSRATARSKLPADAKGEVLNDQFPLIPPATFQSWLFGVLNGGQDSWIMRYMESEFFELARQSIKCRTGGFDVQMVMMACAGLNAARVKVPAILGAILDQVKSQVTSSIVISAVDSQLYSGLLQLAREKAESHSTWLKFHGQHEMRTTDGQIKPLPGNAQSSFWHDGTRFTLEISKPADKNNPNNGVKLDDFVPQPPDIVGQLTVRYFGHSRDPILNLIEHVKKRVAQSQKLDVIEMQAGAPDKGRQRNKRPMSTVDLDPKMMQDIIQDIELFFHPDSQAWYENSGRPYRHGYLLHGPPGTGKTSLSAALASHCNVPLVTITLMGMDDNQLKESFNRVPFKSVVLLEDIDCAGANVGNRATQAAAGQAQAGPLNTTTTIPEAPQTAIVESMMTQFMDKQAIANNRILSKVSAIEGRITDYLGEEPDEDYVPKSRKKASEADKPKITTSSVSLSGLLNVIDGANAQEGRLVVMTTNHPEKLDPALYRAGRIERKFEIGYASKESCVMTFKRLFDNDVAKRYTSEAINRFAMAFQAQFPSHSKVTTAELAKYCGQYRGRPDKAVEEFADWLKVGADKFTCPVDYTQSNDEDGVFNVPEPFDLALLQVSPSDLVDPTAAAASGIEVEVPVKPVPSRFSWTWPRWRRSSIDKDFVQLRAELLSSSGESANLGEQSSLLDGFLQVQTPQGKSVASTDDRPQSSASLPGFSVRTFNQPTVASTTISEESDWDEAHHNQACPVRLPVAPQFSDFWKYQCVSPRPIDGEPEVASCASGCEASAEVIKRTPSRHDSESSSEAIVECSTITTPNVPETEEITESTLERHDSAMSISHSIPTPASESSEFFDAKE